MSSLFIYNFYFTFEFARILFRLARTPGVAVDGLGMKSMKKIKSVAIKSIIHCFTSSAAIIIFSYVPVYGLPIYNIVIVLGIHLLFNCHSAKESLYLILLLFCCRWARPETIAESLNGGTNSEAVGLFFDTPLWTRMVKVWRIFLLLDAPEDLMMPPLTETGASGIVINNERRNGLSSRVRSAGVSHRNARVIRNGPIAPEPSRQAGAAQDRNNRQQQQHGAVSSAASSEWFDTRKMQAPKQGHYSSAVSRWEHPSRVTPREIIIDPRERSRGSDTRLEAHRPAVLVETHR
jgi:hypothetical protein